MTFSLLPPEVHSARMFAGPGSEPMLGLAASSFSSATTQLAGSAWQGPASAVMAAVATTYANAGLFNAGTFLSGVGSSGDGTSGAFNRANNLAGFFR